LRLLVLDRLRRLRQLRVRSGLCCSLWCGLCDLDGLPARISGAEVRRARTAVKTKELTK
jgi:hypothetical protein